ncbi:hypothetical protein J7J95_01060 [bacterium]|nr:hypothetical protein [bacterium]
MHWQKLLILNRKKGSVLLGTEVLAILLHNFLGAWLKTEEAFFFVIAVLLIPGYFLLSILFTTVSLVSKKIDSSRK